MAKGVIAITVAVHAVTPRVHVCARVCEAQVYACVDTSRPIIYCVGAPVPTMSGSSADSHADAFQYHCQCGAPIVADGGHRDVCAELVMVALPESGR